MELWGYDELFTHQTAIVFEYTQRLAAFETSSHTSTSPMILNSSRTHLSTAYTLTNTSPGLPRPFHEPGRSGCLHQTHPPGFTSCYIHAMCYLSHEPPPLLNPLIPNTNFRSPLKLHTSILLDHPPFLPNSRLRLLDPCTSKPSHREQQSCQETHTETHTHTAALSMLRTNTSPTLHSADFRYISCRAACPNREAGMREHGPRGRERLMSFYQAGCSRPTPFSPEYGQHNTRLKRATTHQ